MGRGPPERKQLALRIRNAVLAGAGLVFALIRVTSGAPHLGPAWSAHEGHGTPGTWTATEDRCSKPRTWVGTFTGTSADARSGIRTGIGMDADVTAVGQQFPAVDTGDCGTVFAPGGGDAWIADAAGSAFGAGGILAWIWFVPVRMLRRSAMA